MRLSSLSTATTTAYAAPAPARADPCADPAPPCPACGGLSCLCRPRFFPGQLLGDADLNRLQQYVIDKNRLHNRHLVGWGVACGLEVVCDPCDAGHVTVRAGYALAPCGDDIVVCGDQSVDICALVNACRPVVAACESPYGTQAPTPCTGGPERWVLAVCYDEQAVRPVNALSSATDSVANAGCRCGSGGGKPCSCGAKSAGGCGGGGSTSNGGSCGCNTRGGSYQPAAQRRPLLPQCEPTQVCEGFRFTAYKAPAPLKGLTLPGSQDARGLQGDLMIAWLYANRTRFGPLLERTLCCMLQAMELRAELGEGRSVAAAGAAAVYRDYAQALSEFARALSLHSCATATKSDQLYQSAAAWSATRLQGTLTDADQAELKTRTTALDQSWVAIVAECFCSALLPPCPASPTSNCVPLAVVTLENGAATVTASRSGGSARCRVTDICNWQERKLLVTWPNLAYWFSWLPWQKVRDAFARICCGNGDTQTAYTLMMLMLGVAVNGAKAAASSTTTTTTTTTTTPAPAVAVATPRAARAGTARAVAAPPPGPAAGSVDAALQAPDLLRHMLADYADAQGGEASQPPWAALAARVMDGSAFGPLAGDAAVSRVETGDLDQRLGLAALREQLAALQETVARQQKLLGALQIVRGGGDDAPAPA